MTSGAAGRHYPQPGPLPSGEEHEPGCDCGDCEAERAADDAADAYFDRCSD